VALRKYDLDELIPHRNGMRLIDRLLAADHRTAITETTPTQHWPLRQSDHVSSLVAVEISAQTAGLLVGHQARKIEGNSLHGKGWLVGIKEAAFHQARFRIGSAIQTHARLDFSYQTFHEVETAVFVDKTLAASVTLQIFWIATDRRQEKSS
jgi:predicted hotdog family 3-hydroxylacyl-ACP dehydratase